MRDLTKAKMVTKGLMTAQIFERGEALIWVGISARVALTPEELQTLYAFLKSHYEQQDNTKEQQRKQENHG